jgi:hypothetical protein
MSDEGLLGRWLQWVASAAPGQCPVQDDDGRHGGLRQPDDVWFLAGTFGHASRRTVRVPAGRPVHVPALVMWTVGRHREEPFPPTAYGSLTLDGDPVPLRPVHLERTVVVTGTEGNPITGDGHPTKVAAVAHTATFTPEPGRREVVVDAGDGQGFALRVGYVLDVV